MGRVWGLGPVNPLASILKSNVQGIPALVVLYPIASFSVFTTGFWVFLSFPVEPHVVYKEGGFLVIQTSTSVLRSFGLQWLCLLS